MNTTREPTPKFYVNIHHNPNRDCLDAHEGVHTTRQDATHAAEEYASSYRFTLTDIGKIDLSGEFSDGYQEHIADDRAVDDQIDAGKEVYFSAEAFFMVARAFA